jgi:hypothetical protein
MTQCSGITKVSGRPTRPYSSSVWVKGVLGCARMVADERR